MYESMALGVAPVIIADGFVPPNGPIWNDFIIRVPEEDVPNIEAILDGFSDSYAEMGLKAKEAWEQYFNPGRVTKYYSDALLSCIRSGRNIGTSHREIARWRSFPTYWNNRWTIPQRMKIRLKSIVQR